MNQEKCKTREWLDSQAMACRLCPRACGVRRTERRGYCGMGAEPVLARAALHVWEEPVLCGEKGSGALFFSGCTLGCVYCQNRSISRERFGRAVTEERLADIMLRLQDEGAANIDLITADMFLPAVLRALDAVRGRLTIPVVYNCSGYQRPELIDALDGYVDVYLPDLKYYDSDLSARYSAAPDYFAVASRALVRMCEQTGPPVFDEAGLLVRGTLVRHLVLPGCRKDSMALMEWMARALPKGGFLLSLLSQYTPAFADAAFPELGRPVTGFEYESVVKKALELGLDQGFRQEQESAKSDYRPDFDLTGL